MGRRVKDARLDNRTSRSTLQVRADPYWRLVSEGCHIGYYRGQRVGKWVARFRRPGGGVGYVKKTIGEADDVRDADGIAILSFEQADAAARLWFSEVSHGGSRRTCETIAEVLDAYLDGFTGKSLSKTRARIDAVIRPALGHLKLSALNRQTIGDWHKARARSPAMLRTKKTAAKRNERPAETDEAIRSRRATANRDLTVLKAALNRFADDHPGLPVHAWREVKPFKDVDGAKLRCLSDDEARRLVNACDLAFRAMVQAALLTGARYGELAALRVRDVDLSSQTIWLRDTKAGKPRIVYLEDEGSRLFERATAGQTGEALVFSRPDGKRWNASQQARYVAQACENGKVVPRATFHDLRRTYGARLAIQGTPMAVIAEALGHADERITRRHYAHLSPSYLSTLIRERVSGLGIVDGDKKVSRISASRAPEKPTSAE
jgi:integrase